MEIRNIYEDSYGDERLYSVLMDEDEVALFSEMQKQFGNAANKMAKKLWERSMAAPNVGVKKFLSSPNGRTVINPAYESALESSVRNFRRSQRPTNASEILNTLQTPRPSSRDAIKRSLEYPSRFEDLSAIAGSGSRGIRKSTIRRNALAEMNRGTDVGNIGRGLR